MSITSPRSVSTGSASDLGSPGAKEAELQRKRARDRKAQQAMRDRTKWAISSLSDQVVLLTQVIETKTRDLGALESRLRVLETENAQLRTQNAALQLSLMGSQPRDSSRTMPLVVTTMPSRRGRSSQQTTSRRTVSVIRYCTHLHSQTNVHLRFRLRVLW